jgi:2-polyprenyl-3-methyl-5-hydroxy-6-metoxy-1,4-benzoquinol methylase
MATSVYQFKGDPYSSHSVILSHLREGEGRRLLDVGAATGYLAERLSSRGYEITCLEGDAALAAAASRACSEVLVADLDGPLPPLKGPFDVIVYGDILEHLKDPLRVFVMINEHLRSDGTVIVSVPNVANIWVRIQLLLGKFEYADRGILDRTHMRFFTLNSFRTFLQEANFDVVKLLSTPIPLPLLIPERYQGPIFQLAHSANARLARIWKSLFAYQFVVVARRSKHEA